MLLVEQMKQSVPLMPTAARYLITRLLEIDAKGFPFVELFVFDAMICNYLEDHLLWPEAMIMRDACNSRRQNSLGLEETPKCDIVSRFRKECPAQTQ